MKKQLLSLALTVLLALSLIPTVALAASWANESDGRIPEVAPEVEEFFLNVYVREAITYMEWLAPEDLRLSRILELHGHEVAVQYANAINYFYDTLDPNLDDVLRNWMKVGLGYEEMGKELTPLEKFLTARSMSAPYIQGYTPCSPRPDYSWLDYEEFAESKVLLRRYVEREKPDMKLADPIPVIDTSTSGQVSSGQHITIRDAGGNPIPPSASINPTAPDMSGTQNGPFPDVAPNAWYYDAVTAMKDSGIIQGCDDGLFHPERTITQGEFFAMLIRAGSYEGANISGGHKNSNHWASGIIEVAGRRSFMVNGTAMIGHENDPVDRIEAVVCIADLHETAVRTATDPDIRKGGLATVECDAWYGRWLEVLSARGGMGEKVLEDIVDYEDIQNTLNAYLAKNKGIKDPPVALKWYDLPYIAYAYNTGICNGVDATGTFNPDALLTRAEVAQLFYNAAMTSRIHCLPDIVRGPGAYDFTSTENAIY